MTARKPCYVCGATPTIANLRVDGLHRGICATCVPVVRAANQARIKANAQRFGAGFHYRFKKVS